MKAAIFQATLEKLGVQSSFSSPRVSNDNPYSESLFKTMKYRPKYPFKGFESLDEARKYVSLNPISEEEANNIIHKSN